MNVTFVLPGFHARPNGGFLVVYRYANELTRRGHRVSIVHPRRIEPGPGHLEGLKAAVWPARKKLRYGGRPPWFKLDNAVEVVLARNLSEPSIPLGDVIFATACTTARAVAGYSASRGRKFYLVQHYEDFMCGKDEVDATWRLPMHKVVSSRWLYGIGASLNVANSCTHIPYGVEHDIFDVTVPIRDRSPAHVGMLVHWWPVKGTQYGIEAVEEIRKAMPETKAVAFGARPRPASLPPWIEYIESPSRADLVAYYNSLAVFLHTSTSEGWGLTGAEAMACGCALVAADSGGVLDYAVDGRTALVVPPRDSAALAAATLDLIGDGSRRIALAEAGVEEVRALTWERAANALDEVIRAER